jgi:hypothetical protein
MKKKTARFEIRLGQPQKRFPTHAVLTNKGGDVPRDGEWEGHRFARPDAQGHGEVCGEVRGGPVFRVRRQIFHFQRELHRRRGLIRGECVSAL